MSERYRADSSTLRRTSRSFPLRTVACSYRRTRRMEGQSKRRAEEKCWPSAHRYSLSVRIARAFLLILVHLLNVLGEQLSVWSTRRAAPGWLVVLRPQWQGKYNGDVAMNSKGHGLWNASFVRGIKSWSTYRSTWQLDPTIFSFSSYLQTNKAQW